MARVLVLLSDVAAQQSLIFIDRSQDVPMPEERVNAITPTSGCPGFIDSIGVWRHDDDGSPIMEDVIGWLPFE